MDKKQASYFEMYRLNLSFLAVVFALLVCSHLHAQNPFYIPFSAKEDLTNEDYIEVQNLLREVNLVPLVKELASKNPEALPYEEFKFRVERGISQELINPANGFYPEKNLVKIGNGGDNCIVCCAPFRIRNLDGGSRAQFSRSMPEDLADTGFNGYLLTMTGGFPNPTGKEICYAGVPYSFKIFLMLEAQKLGFNKVIWIDSACLPINDPTPLFNHLEKNDALLYKVPMYTYAKRFIFSETCQVLKEMTQVNVLDKDCHHIVTIVFGLKMDAPKTKRLVEEYYKIVEDGRGFLSCFPEEFVLSAIIAMPYFQSWKPYPQMRQLYNSAGSGTSDSWEKISNAKSNGCFFWQRTSFKHLANKEGF